MHLVYVNVLLISHTIQLAAYIKREHIDRSYRWYSVARQAFLTLISTSPFSSGYLYFRDYVHSSAILFTLKNYFIYKHIPVMNIAALLLT